MKGDFLDDLLEDKKPRCSKRKKAVDHKKAKKRKKLLADLGENLFEGVIEIIIEVIGEMLS